MRGVRRPAVILIIAVSLLGIASTPAHAGACGPNGVCVYSGVYFSGGFVSLPGSTRVSNFLAKHLNNQASSIRNDNVTNAVFLYAGKGGRGKKLCVPGGQSIPDFTAFDFNDKASSSKVRVGPDC